MSQTPAPHLRPFGPLAKNLYPLSQVFPLRSPSPLVGLSPLHTRSLPTVLLERLYPFALPLTSPSLGLPPNDLDFSFYFFFELPGRVLFPICFHSPRESSEQPPNLSSNRKIPRNPLRFFLLFQTPLLLQYTPLTPCHVPLELVGHLFPVYPRSHLIAPSVSCPFFYFLLFSSNREFF